MKQLLTLLTFLILHSLFFIHHSFAQQGLGVGNTDPQELLDVSGAIRIGETVTSSPVNPGTIRWNDIDDTFEGWDGTQWVVFGSNVESEITLLGSNTTAVNVYSPVKYYRHDNRVYLSGKILKNGGPATVMIGTLPVGYRPSSDVHLPMERLSIIGSPVVFDTDYNNLGSLGPVFFPTPGGTYYLTITAAGEVIIDLAGILQVFLPVSI